MQRQTPSLGESKEGAAWGASDRLFFLTCKEAAFSKLGFLQAIELWQACCLSCNEALPAVQDIRGRRDRLGAIRGFGRMRVQLQKL